MLVFGCSCLGMVYNGVYIIYIICENLYKYIFVYIYIYIYICTFSYMYIYSLQSLDSIGSMILMRIGVSWWFQTFS